MGAPRLRSIELMKAAPRYAQKLIISEEIYLALRPRHFVDFDDKNPIQVAPGLVGYSFRQVSSTNNLPKNSANFQPPPSTSRSNPNARYEQEFAPHKDFGSSAESTDNEDADVNMRLIEETTQSTTLPTFDTNSPQLSRPPDLHSLSFFAQQNHKSEGQPMSPKHSMFDSMNSSASELYSIDLSVETGRFGLKKWCKVLKNFLDSDMEWVTPENLVYDRIQKHRRQNNQSAAGTVSLMDNQQRTTYKGEHAKQYSDFSEIENIRGSSRFRRKR